LGLAAVAAAIALLLPQEAAASPEDDPILQTLKIIKKASWDDGILKAPHS
jgi:hypothetical protein